MEAFLATVEENSKEIEASAQILLKSLKECKKDLKKLR